MSYYKGIGPNAGIIVMADEAMEYALGQCGLVVDARATVAREFLKMLPEWFFSGAWIKEGDDDMENENIGAVPGRVKSAGNDNHRVTVRHVGRVNIGYGNLWLGGATGCGVDKTLAAVINEEMDRQGIDTLDGLAELTLVITPIEGAGTNVEVV